MAIELNNSWKRPFDKESKSSLSVISLYDLIWYNDSTTILYTKDNNLLSTAKAGASLQHDILSLTIETYNLTTGQHNESTSGSNEKPPYRIYFFNKNYNAEYPKNKIQCDGTTFYYPTKEYIQQLVESSSPNSLVSTKQQKPFITNIFDKESNSNYSNYPGVISGVYVSETTAWTGGKIFDSNGCEIVLLEKDDIFQSIIEIGDGQSAFNKLALNPYCSYTKSLLDYVAVVYGNATAVYGTKINNNNLIKEAAGDGSTDNKTVADFKYKEALKSIYVVVEAPVYADYINSNDFDQSLNQTSDVQFQSLFVGNTKTNRYLNPVSADTTTTTTYKQKINPIIDSITYKAVKDDGAAGNSRPNELAIDKTNISKFITKEASAEASKKNMHCGPQWQSDKVSDTSILDVDYLQSDLEYYKDNILAPQVFNTKGDAYIDGRIISPTIDDLWLAIKKLTSGFAERKYGPAGTENKGTFIKSDGKTNAYSIFYESLELENKTIDDNIKFGKTLTRNDNLADISTPNLSEIYKTLCRVAASHEEVTGPTTASYNFSNINNNYAYELDAEAPLSLRELEALSKINKSNIDTVFDMLAHLLTPVGELGYKDNNNLNQGTLYALHKEYKANELGNDMPSTYYDGTSDGSHKISDYAKWIGSNGSGAGNYKDFSYIENFVEGAGNKNIEKGQVYLAADGTWHYVNEHPCAVIIETKE